MVRGAIVQPRVISNKKWHGATRWPMQAADDIKTLPPIMITDASSIAIRCSFRCSFKEIFLDVLSRKGRRRPPNSCSFQSFGLIRDKTVFMPLGRLSLNLESFTRRHSGHGRSLTQALIPSLGTSHAKTPPSTSSFHLYFLDKISFPLLPGPPL